jgi:hypothetical protein
MFELHVRVALAGALVPLLCMARPAVGKPRAPSQAMVIAWLMPEYKVKFHAKSRRIVMRSGEVAYLIPVTLTDVGRNFRNAVVLARPKEKSAQFLDAENATLGAIHDSGSKGISLVEVHSTGSGQGTTVSGKSLVLFDGLEPVELHGAEERDNMGSCGQEIFHRDCYSIRVKWTLRDLDQDGLRT